MLLLGFFVHLMFGSCQTTRWHYIAQLKYYKWAMPMRHNSSFMRQGAYLYGGRYYNGIWRTWYSDGSLKSEINCINGRMNGLYTIWDHKGNKREERVYVNGRVNGYAQTYFANGQKSSIAQLEDNKRISGTLKCWHKDGTTRNPGDDY